MSSAPRVPGPRAPGFDEMKDLRVPARERDVLLAEPAALGQQDEDADEHDEQSRARDARDREHEPDDDQRERRHPSRQASRETIDRYPGDSNASVA
jgi:hypothetical protein